MTRRRVDLRADADQPAKNCELYLARNGVQRDEPRVDLLTSIPSRADPRDDPGPYLYLHFEAQYPRQDGPARDAVLELVDLRAGLTHVERPDHEQLLVRGESVKSVWGSGSAVLYTRLRRRCCT